MIWLAWHMWFLLLVAFFLGLLIGWWIWHRSRIDIAAAQEHLPVEAPSQSGLHPQSPNSGDGKRPALYTAGPTDGPADDLKKIKGIGPKYEKLLNEIGIYYYRQIVSWTAEEIGWLDKKLEFPGRIEREDWQTQAATLRDGKKTEFSDRYEDGDTPSSY